MKLGTFTITRNPRRRRAHGPSLRMPVIVALASVIVIGLHEFAYRRFIPQQDTEYELWGTISHAGADMMTLALVVLAAVVVEIHRNTDGAAPE